MTASVFYHPSAAFFALAILLPFVRGDWWRWLLPLPAIVAIVSVSTVAFGEYGQLSWMGFPLSVGRVDALSRVFAHVFAIQALLGFIYAFHLKDKRQHVASCFYVGGGFGAVFAGDYLSLFLFLEIMSVASTMLIWLNTDNNPRARGAGLRYFLLHTLGGLFVLAGALLRYKAIGTFAFTAVDPLGAQYYDWLILIGFGVNAAVIGLHAWLPDAYPEATITGAVFMSAYTTKTAVYTLARAFSGFEVLAWMGVAMTLYGVIYASMENQARRILSYHIMSQVGYMVAGVGIGTAMTLNGATAHAYAHILYKGLLFMSVGAILFSAGTAKLNELGGLAARMPGVMLCYLVAGLSISGAPLFNGFISKTMTIAGAFEDHKALLGIGMELAAVGTFLSVGIKLPYFAFFGGKPTDMQRELRPIPANMMLAMILGAGLCIAQGVAPQLLYVLLPFPEEAARYHPWTVWAVFQTLMLLSFTGLAFYLNRRTMTPHAQRNLDFEYFYILVGRSFVRFFCAAVAFLDAIWSEVYARVGLRGLLGGAKATSVFDKKGIDFVVDGSAYTTRAVGGRAARMQTGRLQDYLAGAMALACAAFFLVWILR